MRFSMINDATGAEYDEYFTGVITLTTKKGIWIQWDDIHSKHKLLQATYNDEWLFVDEKPESQEE